MSGILVYSEKQAITWELLGKAQVLAPALGQDTSVALLGPGAGELAGAAFAHGAQTAYLAEDEILASIPSEQTAMALAEIAERSQAGLVLIGSTLRGKAIAARLAQKLNAGCVTDALGLIIEDGRLIAHRYAYGGRTVAVEAFTSERIVVALTPRHGATPVVENRGGVVVPVSLTLPPARLRIVGRQPKEGGTENIETAERVVAVGRGVKRKEDLALIEKLALALGAAVGCTRTLAFDYKWLPDTQLIGLSGKKIAPRLYVGVGVSGQIQHMMGASGARLIVAINADKNAPIFEYADYGAVGDLYQIVPKLIEQLSS